MKPTDKPPVNLVIDVVYKSWIESLKDYQSMQVDPGNDSRHRQILLEHLQEIHDEAIELRAEAPADPRLRLILSRSVKDHLMLTRWGHKDTSSRSF